MDWRKLMKIALWARPFLSYSSFDGFKLRWLRFPVDDFNVVVSCFFLSLESLRLGGALEEAVSDVSFKKHKHCFLIYRSYSEPRVIGIGFLETPHNSERSFFFLFYLDNANQKQWWGNCGAKSTPLCLFFFHIGPNWMAHFWHFWCLWRPSVARGPRCDRGPGTSLNYKMAALP